MFPFLPRVGVWSLELKALSRNGALKVEYPQLILHDHQAGPSDVRPSDVFVSTNNKQHKTRGQRKSGETMTMTINMPMILQYGAALAEP